MIKNGRQTAPTLAGIRDDHLERYRYAIRRGQHLKCRTVADVGCGTGYGAYMMAQAGFIVDAYEIDPEAVEYGNKYYRHKNLRRHVADIAWLDIREGYDLGPVDMLTMFEIVEHTDQAPAFLARARADHLIASVPNEEVVPFETSLHWQHYRHYTPQQFADELKATGWNPALGCQTGKHKKKAVVRWDTTEGRTLIAYANRSV